MNNQPDPFDTLEWWHEGGFLIGLDTLLGPVRDPYFGEALADVPNAKVLDVGCGGGFVADALKALGHEVTGLDSSSGALSAARPHCAGGIVRADAHDLPFPDSYFDSVVCSEVLEHVDEPEKVVHECARVLRTGGRFLFSTPNRTWLSRMTLINAAQEWRATRILPAELHRWNRFIKPMELEALLSSARLSLMDLKGISIAIRHLPDALGALYALKRGDISFAEAGRRIRLSLNKNAAVSYIGVAIKSKPGRA